MNNVLSEALQQFVGLLNQLLKNLLGNEAESWGNELKKFLRKEPCWVATTKEKILDLLQPLDITTAVPATTSKFIPRDNFKLLADGGFCSYIWPNFANWFLDKIEEPIGEQILQSYKLLAGSVDGPIVAELGGEAKAEVTLQEMFFLLKKQDKGQEGVLLTNGNANIFYIRDKNNILRAVYADWDDGGWYLNACDVSNPSPWDDGSLVFSRRPSAT